MNTTVSRRNRWALLITAVMLLIIFAWTHGIFDNFLWRVGLNYQDCAQNAFGAVYCGDSLHDYQKQISAP